MDDEHARREEAIRQAREIGMIGLIGEEDGGGHLGSIFGRDGIDAGSMFGTSVGESFGAGGLGLSGSGGGGGGQGESIGLGNVGTIGRGGTGTGQGFGSGHGRLGGNHLVHTPRIRQGQTTVTGKLPPEVIQRIVRQNFGRFRLCYENGLRTDPKLTGTVGTKFVIDAQGAVSTASRDASTTTMTDGNVVSCVNRGFGNLSFPQPESGIVVVIFPLVFEPGD
jgi:hypothetical protein